MRLNLSNVEYIMPAFKTQKPNGRALSPAQLSAEPASSSLLQPTLNLMVREW